jgi:nucleoside-diphosphate-sugar epimerase
MFYVNAESTFNLLEFARDRGVKRFITASTGAVTLPSTDFYSNTKRCAEALASSYGEFFSVIIPRLFFPYGHGQQQERLMPQLFKKVRAKETITIDGNPGMHMNPIYIDDAVEVLNGLLSLHHSATLDVSGPEVLTVSGIVHRMEGIVGHFTDVKYKKPPQATWNLVGDTAGMSVLTGVKPEVGIDEGIMRMVNW